jgi:beta-N-acetylhexosaminidase
MARSLRHLTLALTALSLMLLSSCGTGARTTGPAASATPTPKPTATARSTPRPNSSAMTISGVPLSVQALVNAEMTSMTLAQKLGQMIQIETYYQTYAPDVDYMVRVLGAGSMIIYGKNMATAKQLKKYISDVQNNANMPMFITIDEEGGDVDRLGYQKFNPPLPSAQWLASTGNPQIAYQAGVTAARELASYGINVDLAPVVDVDQVPDPVEGERLFGSDPQTVDKYAAAFLKGLEDNGVIGCLKHWPGIGILDSKEDPHLTLPTIKSSLDQLDATDFAAFQGILPQLGQDTGMIMVTHVLEPAIDPTLPSSLSPASISILRNQLGYNGVIITDNLYMQAISKKYNFGQAVVMAVEAGDDILANAWDSQSMEWAISALQSAINSGQISVARINQSVQRILTLKAMHGLFLKYYGSTGNGQSAQVAQPAAGSAMVADMPRRVH